ncbi:NAD(P)-dependent oxidoreductase [Paenibacillus sp. IITD108]|uniref:NAD(P)-dependent oxidoreductase n=1 Tax=Paenibacillus sp. IITD108 TaxID=3116649 RepID=UPI002F42E7E8
MNKLRELNEQAFSLMKDNCIIINTSRGAVIDEEAFVKELEKGRFFACLDVTEPEPPALDHPFRCLPNVILTSHIAGAVNNGLYRIGKYLMHELASFMENKLLHGEVKREHLSSIA